MMTIREYFAALYADALTDEDFDEVVDFEQTIYHCMDEDYDDFTMWATENGIDLTATDDGETVLTLWAWDMCGD